jgi:hypothetical protein
VLCLTVPVRCCEFEPNHVFITYDWRKYDYIANQSVYSDTCRRLLMPIPIECKQSLFLIALLPVGVWLIDMVVAGAVVEEPGTVSLSVESKETTTIIFYPTLCGWLNKLETTGLLRIM